MSKHCYPRSCYEMAAEHIIHAMRHARSGEHERTHHHLDLSSGYAHSHARRLKAQGQHDEAAKIQKEHEVHVAAVKKILESVMAQATKPVKKSEHKDKIPGGLADKKKPSDFDQDQLRAGIKVELEHTSDHAMAQEIAMDHLTEDPNYYKKLKTIEKAAPPMPLMSASPARKEAMAGGPIQTTQTVAKPGQDARFDYRPIHLLHPEDQIGAQQKFGTQHIGKYEYPVDKETGRLVHARRSPLPADKSPKAHVSAYRELQPQHTPGTTVRIHAPGAWHHERFGIVRPPSPYMPGKIPVQIGSTQHHTVFVEPHEVKTSQPASRMEKAMLTRYSVEKALLRKKDGSA